MCAPSCRSSYPEVMRKDSPVIQECFLRAGAEFDSWAYTWRVRGLAAYHVIHLDV